MYPIVYTLHSVACHACVAVQHFFEVKEPGYLLQSMRCNKSEEIAAGLLRDYIAEG